MFEGTLRWLNKLGTRQLPARRRRKSLLAFGDRLETRTMLSAVVIEFVPNAEVMAFANPEAPASNDSAMVSTDGEIEISKLDAAFFDLTTTTSNNAEDVTDTPEPLERAAADTESDLPRVPAPTLLVVTNPRQAELLTTLYRSLPAAIPPDVATTPVETSSSVVRLDALNDSGAPIRLIELSSNASREIQPAAAESLQEGSLSSGAETTANRRSEVINSLFNRLVPEPEPRDAQPPRTTVIEGAEPRPTTEPMTIASEATEESSPANPPRSTPTIEPSKTAAETAEPIIEMKADDAEAQASERHEVTTIVAAGAFLLSAQQELWRRTRRQLRHMRRRVR